MEIKDNFFFLNLFIFFCGILSFCLNYQYLLINLIRLEFIILRLFLLSYMYMVIVKYELIFSIIFIRFIVGEGVLGLSLIIALVRSIGNNYFQSINLFKW